MTAAASTGAGGPTGGAWKWVVPLLLAVVVTVLVLPSGNEDRRYDLNSAQPDGYRGLRLLLEETGVDVDRVDAADIDGSSIGAYDVVFVPRGGEAGRELTQRWDAYASAGGQLVLGSPSDRIGAPPAWDDTDDPFGDPFAGGASESPGDCSIADLADGGSIDLPFSAVPIDAAESDASCFGDGYTSFVALENTGAGAIVTVASPDLFTNETMGAPEPDEPVGQIPGNAFVARRVLGSGPGVGQRLAIVTTGIEATTTSGEKQLTDYMSPGVKLGLLELGVAFGFYAFFRGRRHGRIVSEAAPVTIAGSAFVEAVGSLLERQGDVGRAAEVLRDGQCRELARRLGRPRSIPRAELAGVLAERTGRDPAEVATLLTGPVETDADLVTLTRELDSLRQEALHV